MCMPATEKIEKQQAKEKGRTAAWMVGEQLKDIARREPESEELLDRDLDIPEMSIQQAEKEIQAWADAHKTGNFACVTPLEAERILRKFYGLRTPSTGERELLPAAAAATSLKEGGNEGRTAASAASLGEGGDTIIDLGAFL